MLRLKKITFFSTLHLKYLLRRAEKYEANLFRNKIIIGRALRNPLQLKASSLFYCK